MTRPLILFLLLAACDDKGVPPGESELSDDSAPALDEDGDGVSSEEDCDDNDAAVYPGAEEICDGLDNNCDDQTDEGVQGSWYVDADQDGYGQGEATLACTAPEGSVALDGDCDDADPLYHPGATEEDCADPNDYNCDGSVGYADGDGDGFPACEECDDSDATVNPDAAETCDTLDNDCNGQIDEGEALGSSSWYVDADGDGYGDADYSSLACTQPSGYVADSSDCDDSDGANNPAATETCDGEDNNCDGQIDEGSASDASTWYQDIDGDGYGDADYTTLSCAQPSGYVSDSTDCDDANSGNNPAATETCDGDDDDCDGQIDEPDASDASTWYQDIDGDGYGDVDYSTQACSQPSGYVGDSSDCNDSDSGNNPDATEVCDSADNDCDGITDESDAADASTWYQDSDGDGFGDAGSTTPSCSQPSGYVADSADCDDSDGGNNPDATEVCDSADNDCDGITDESDAADASTWYADSDKDGYGNASVSTVSCTAPSGYVSDKTDCNDSSSKVNPGAAEVYYNGVDDACNGGSDYDADGDGDDAEAYGGGDCNDADATAYTGHNCRPTATCTSPSATTLASYDPGGASDFVFDDSCVAYVSTVVSGTDYVYKITTAGHTATITGYSNYNIPAVGVTSAGKVVVSHNDNSTNGLGLQGSGTSISNLATGTLTIGSSWSNSYLNYCSSSIAVEGSTYAYVPNFAGSGTLVKVTLSGGSKSTLTTLSSRIEGAGFDSSGNLYVSSGATIYKINTSTGSSSTYYTASATVLDFVFDYNDDLYIETTGNVILLVDASLSASTFSSVSGDGKLDIAPDGRLVRMLPNPSSSATWQEWSLGD